MHKNNPCVSVCRVGVAYLINAQCACAFKMCVTHPLLLELTNVRSGINCFARREICIVRENANLVLNKV